MFYQYSDDDENRQKHTGKLTSAQRAQIVWRVILRIGSDYEHDAKVMSLNQLLQAGIITAAYPVHDGSIKHEEGEDPDEINDRRVRIIHRVSFGSIGAISFKSHWRFLNV